jgi:hypothetical protein
MVHSSIFRASSVFNKLATCACVVALKVKEGKVTYIRFIAHTTQDNSESEVTGEELDEFRGRYLRKKIHTTMISAQKRRFKEIYAISTSNAAATSNYT